MPNKLKDMKIKEISAVTKGANRKQWLIVKSEDGENAMTAEDLYQVGIEAFGMAINKTVRENDEPDEGAITKMQDDIETSFEEFAEFMKDAMAGSFAENIGRKNLRDRLWTATDALYEAIQTTLNNPDIDQAQKVAAVEQDLSDFTDWVTEQLRIGKEVKKAGAVISSDRLRRLKETHESLGAIITEAEGSKDYPDKGGSVKKGDDSVVKAEDISKMVGDALAPITERLDALEKQAEPNEPNKDDDVTKAVTEAITKAMEPIVQRLEVIEKAKGFKKSIDGKGNDPEEVKKSFWGGVL